MKEKKMRNLSENTLRKYLMGECSDDELIEVNTWIKESDEHARQLFRMEEVYHLGKLNPHDEEQKRAYAEKKLYKKLKQEQQKQCKAIRIRQWVRYAAAVVIFLMIGGGAGYWFLQNESEMLIAVADEGIVKEVILSDGTKVWLNNTATLTYPRKFSGKDRNVSLEGEAYFEVTKNAQQPFIVESDAMRIRVLGTIFNFKCSKTCRVAEATLIEGEIEVKGKQQEGQIILSPGQRAELNKATGRLTVKQVDAKMDAVWHDDLIPFEQANIFAITKTLERFYDVKIIISPDVKKNKTYSGVLKKESTIESVLKSLQNSIPMNYKIVGNNIFISPANQ